MTLIPKCGLFLTNVETCMLRRILHSCKFSKELNYRLQESQKEYDFFRELFNLIESEKIKLNRQIKNNNDYYETELLLGKTVQHHRVVYYRATHPRMSDSELLNYMNMRASEGFEIHHIDRNKTNNSIFNLYEVYKNDHRKLHSFKYIDPLIQFELVKKTMQIVNDAR